MIVSAAAAYGVTLQQAQTRGGLACVDDACRCAAGFRNVHRGECGDAAQALHEVERHPLSLQHALRGAMHVREHRAACEGLTVLPQEMGLNGWVR